MVAAPAYPVRVDADLDAGLSRWLWLVKWFLAIPHYVVLAFLWVAFGVLTVVAFFAVLFTARYPRSIFAFNVGVLRWTWRVQYYSFGANGTDRYPPFTLAEVPEYPTHLAIAYPERLSRGLIFVKWLLALPHLLIVGILVGGGSIGAWTANRNDVAVWGNLLGVLVLIAVVALLFTGTYPRALFDLIIGLNRWVLRVAAYVALMTDTYPPFRLDMGGHEDGALALTPEPAGPAGGAIPSRPDATHGTAGWTGGRIVALIVGSVLVLASIGVIGAGSWGIWADTTQRDADGYLTTVDERFSTDTFAIATDRIELVTGPRWTGLADGFGDVRVRVTATDADTPVFVGIARADAVDRYLTGVPHGVLSDVRDVTMTTRGGAERTIAPPETRGFWATSDVGIGTREITWTAMSGNWTIVAMNADGTPGIDVTADVGATVPGLTGIAIAALIAGVALFFLGAALVGVAATRASRTA